LGLIWIVDGLLKLQPYFFTHFVSGVIDPSAAGQPAVIGHPITWIGNLIRPHQGVFVVLAVLGELSIGVGLLVRATVKPACTAPLYIVAGLLVWPRTPQAQDAEQPAFGLLGEWGARLLWSALWLATAALWLFHANAAGDATSAAFTSAPSGAGWLSSLQSSAANLVNGSGMTVAVLLAVVSAEVGLCVLWGRGTRIALIGSMAVSLAFWFLAEGLGGLFTGQATDVGTAPLMILIAALLLPLAARPSEHLNQSLFPRRQEVTGDERGRLLA